MRARQQERRSLCRDDEQTRCQPGEGNAREMRAAGLGGQVRFDCVPERMAPPGPLPFAFHGLGAARGDQGARADEPEDGL